jgi:radical SAM protein with 4Fe4S-binding SPASM domain
MQSPRALVLRAWQAAERLDPELVYLFFEITRACNLSCRHCGSDCGTAPRGRELSTEDWLNLAARVRADFGTKPFIVITGGEPLVHPDLLRIGARCRDLGLAWGLVSNARAWKDGLMAELLRAGLRSLTISLDGPEPAHTFLRGDGNSFRQALRAFDDAAEARGRGEEFTLDAVTCVHPLNLGLLDQTAEILIDHQVPGWRVFRIFPKGRAGQDPTLSLSSGQTEELLAWVESRKPRLARRGLRLSLSCEGWFPHKRERRLRPQPSFCRSGISFASIKADGTIAGCPNNALSLDQGNALTDSLREIWERGFTEHRGRAWLKATECAACPHLKDCRGGALHLWDEGLREPSFCYHQTKCAPLSH